MKKIYIILLIFFLVGCGGGGGSSSSSASSDSSDSSSSSSQTSLVSGFVVDGYIKNADVCLDLNLNNNCDENEPKTKSLEDGSYNFENIIIPNDFIVIICANGEDIATNKHFGETIRNVISKNEQLTNIFVSPLSDLYTILFLESSNKNATNLSSAKTQIATIFNINENALSQNPMNNKELFAKTQYLQFNKKILRSFNSDLDAIKKELIKNQDITTLVDNLLLESEHKDFVKRQINSNKEIFDSFANDTFIQSDKFAQLQKNIDLQMDEIIENKSFKVIDSILKEQLNIEFPKVNLSTPPQLPRF